MFRTMDLGMRLGGRKFAVCRVGLQRRGVGLLVNKEEHRRVLRRSWDRGSAETPLITQTIPEHFASVVSRYGDRPAIIAHARGKRTVLRFRELDEESGALARGLRGVGVKKGDRVGVMLGNNWEGGVCSYGLWKLGAILVPLNPAFTTTQLTSAMNHLGIEHLIIGLETTLPFKAPKSNLPLLKDIVDDLESASLKSQHIPTLRNLILVDNSTAASSTPISALKSAIPFSSLLSSASKSGDVSPIEPLSIHETINIQFTSGTTSSPKASQLSHYNILNNGSLIGDRLALTAEDKMMVPPPLFHCFGSVLGYMATATHGSAIVWAGEAFHPQQVVDVLRSEEARGEGLTGLYGVSTMFIAVLDLLAQSPSYNAEKEFKSLRKGIAAGSLVPRAVMERLSEVLGLDELCISYGMTETSPVSLMTSAQDPLEKRVDSVGKLLPHTEAKIIIEDPELGQERVCGVGERGELVVSGYLLMSGYYNDQDKTDEVLKTEEGGKRWMYTGDEAEMDAQGYVRITGRIKDLIIRGGENIHPGEVENVLLGMPGVREASVVGISDERYGEVVGVFIVPRRGVKLGEDDARALLPGWSAADEDGAEECLGTAGVREHVRIHLSGHLVPKYVWWIEEYPKTASGKIQKFRLREMGEERVAALLGR